MSKNTSQGSIPIASHRINENKEEEQSPYLSIDSEEDEVKQQQSEEKETKVEEETKAEQETEEEEAVDLFSKRLEQDAENAPKTEEQFYQKSFDIFSRLHDCVKESNPNQLQELKKSEISEIVSGYMDLVHDYEGDTTRKSIWDLAYFLYFSTEEIKLAERLNEWLESYKHLSEHIDDLEYDEGSIDFTWIWEYSRRNLLRGNYTEAINTLNKGKDTLKENQLYAVNEIIGLIQKFSSIQEHQKNPTVYASEWSSLHKESGQALEKFMKSRDEQFNEFDDEIKLLYDILAGDENAIFKSGQYYERVVGSLLFCRPSTTRSGLYHIAQRAVDSDKEIDIPAYILMGCFDDAFDACNDLWLQTHLGHALIAVGATSPDITSNASSDREVVTDPMYHCIERYATMIAEQNNMWKEAVIYLSACAENREYWIKKLLNETTLKDKDMELLRDVLKIAEEQDMIQIQNYIHRVIGKRFEHQKDIKNATIEYGKAHDLESLDRFAHVQFSHYLKTGKLDDVVINSEQVKASPHYSILILYHDFRSHLDKKEWKQASKTLLELLKCEHLPTKFEMVLLIDNLAILEDTKQHYTQQDMMHLIDIFKIVTKDTSNEEFLSKYYKLMHHKELPSTVVSAKLRERIAYRAATAASS